eukprot:COSAG06_NODE_19507_length_835_cov_0.796196_2_plen_24_part_01
MDGSELSGTPFLSAARMARPYRA